MSPNVNVSLCWGLLALERISNNTAFGYVIFGACVAVFLCNEGGLTCARWVMFNLNRFDVRDYRCLLATSHSISEIFDRILKPVYLLQSAKMFTWEMLEFFIDRKCSKEFPRIIFVYNQFIENTPFILPLEYLLCKFGITYATYFTPLLKSRRLMLRYLSSLNYVR